MLLCLAVPSMSWQPPISIVARSTRQVVQAAFTNIVVQALGQVQAGIVTCCLGLLFVYNSWVCAYAQWLQDDASARSIDTVWKLSCIMWGGVVVVCMRMLQASQDACEPCHTVRCSALHCNPVTRVANHCKSGLQDSHILQL